MIYFHSRNYSRGVFKRWINTRNRYFLVFSDGFLSLCVKGIHIYQKTLSPDHGLLRAIFPYGVCRFSPTCSEFAIKQITIDRWWGVARTIRRVCSCHPFS